MEPPSRQLLELLSRYALATSADVRRCRPQVRRLAHDLPTFDSIWIDALTQSRVLTPFQARLLESEQPQRLQVGPCVLVDEWEKDGRWTLRLAKHRGSQKRCLLTFLDVPAHDLPKAQQQVRDVISRLQGLSHPSVIVPQGCDESDRQLVVVSPYVTGPTLKQLLVRRGRFPIAVVTDIAWQLIDGLAALEDREVVHGDVTLTSVRLTERGQVVLLHPGVLPAVGSRVSIHAPLGPENYDGTAPELISTGRTATHQSDLYAVGCVLWQLLAGRPPYPTGDPLAKLSAHQTKPIDDVRRWVPDAPAELSALIRLLTSKNPEQRGSGPAELRDHWPLGKRFGRSRLAQFHSSFGTVAPQRGDVHRSASKFPLTAAAVLLFVLSGVSLSLLDAGARNELLRLAGRVTETADHAPAPIADAAGAAIPGSNRADLLPFPSRPVNGVIELTSAGPYAAADVSVDGPLEIRGTAGVVPQVVVRGQPLRLAASLVKIERVQFIRESDAGNVPVLVAMRCQQAIVEGCRFNTADDASDKGGPPVTGSAPSTAIAWQIADTANPTGGKLLMRNTIINGPLHALDTHSMPRLIRFENCLKSDAGVLVRMAHAERSAPLRVHLHQLTLRHSGGILRWSNAAADDALQPLLLIAENCVFDVPPHQGALLEFAEPVPPPHWERMIRATGEGSLLQGGTVLAASNWKQESNPTTLETSQLRVEGLLIDAFEFAGPDIADPQASVVVSTQAPRTSSVPPGINAAKLAGAAAAAVVRQAARP